jgi:hypothetical protein
MAWPERSILSRERGDGREKATAQDRRLLLKQRRLQGKSGKCIDPLQVKKEEKGPCSDKQNGEGYCVVGKVEAGMIILAVILRLLLS